MLGRLRLVCLSVLRDIDGRIGLGLNNLIGAPMEYRLYTVGQTAVCLWTTPAHQCRERRGCFQDSHRYAYHRRNARNMARVELLDHAYEKSRICSFGLYRCCQSVAAIRPCAITKFKVNVSAVSTGFRMAPAASKSRRILASGMNNGASGRSHV